MGAFGLGLATTLAIGLDALSGIREFDGLEGLAHWSEGFSASASENREICCMTTRPTGVQWAGEPGILLKVKGSYNQKILEQPKAWLSVPV